MLHALTISGGNAANLTMSSREIAGLVDSRHDNVKRTIEMLVAKAVIVQPQTEDERSADAMGRNRSTQVYQLCKRSSLIVVAQLCPEFTARVVDRWQELEAAQASPAPFRIPGTLSEALRLAAELEEKRSEAVAALEAIKPKAEALGRIAEAEGAMCVTNAAKVLQVQPKALFSWLSQNRWIYRRPGGSGWVSYQDRIQSGHLEHKVTNLERSDRADKVVEQVMVTPRGLALLAKSVPYGKQPAREQVAGRVFLDR